MSKFNPFSSTAAWVNAALVPAKVHVVCCGIIPAAAAAFGSHMAVDALETTAAQIVTGIVTPPLVTYGVMLAEQKMRRKKQKAACTCDGDNKSLTLRNYLKQTALSYAFSATMLGITHLFLPHEHGSDCRHGQNINSHQNCDENWKTTLYSKGKCCIKGLC